MGERDPHHSRCVAAIDLAVLVIGGEDLLVVIPGTRAPARAPLAHSEPMAVAPAFEQEPAQMEGGRISDLALPPPRLELSLQAEVADRRGGDLHQRRRARRGGGGG